MYPKLSTLNGPLRIEEFPILKAVSIGRALSNHIYLDDPSLAAQHCRLELVEGRVVLTDLNTVAGTFVNGIPVRERELVHGDHIGVGETTFLFQSETAHALERSKLQLDDRPHEDAKVRALHSEDLDLLQDEPAAAQQEEKQARNLKALVRISSTIGSLRDADALQWQLLGMIFDVIPAERGAVLLVDPGSREIASHVAWDRVEGPEHPVNVSEPLLQKVMNERVFVLESAGAQSVLCVPLASGDRLFGVVYLESANPEAPLTEDDLQMVSAIGGLAGIALENARQFERLGLENQQLRATVNLEHDMVGSSPRMREVYQFIERVAPSDATVLIHGESGTGKELAARAIHKNSPRKAQPFVALNCAALTESLLESELFGHEKGSFTSAIGMKKGLLEVAEGGSVFLDEVGELPLVLQAKLLRVLQEREFMRVGGTRPIKLDVRFLAATNRDLQKMVREERFRPDLFHRLNVISITLPALREHQGDIPQLAEYFAARYAKKCNRVLHGISPAALSALKSYEWPGNIRELENAMERAVVIGSSAQIQAEDLPESLLDMRLPAGSAPAKYHDAIRELKKHLLLSALEQTGGNFTEAAKILGVHANYLHRLIKNLDLRVELKKYMKA